MSDVDEIRGKSILAYHDEPYAGWNLLSPNEKQLVARYFRVEGDGILVDVDDLNMNLIIRRPDQEIVCSKDNHVLTCKAENVP